jgi:hypothetical protein
VLLSEEVQSTLGERLGDQDPHGSEYRGAVQPA